MISKKYYINEEYNTLYIKYIRADMNFPYSLDFKWEIYFDGAFRKTLTPEDHKLLKELTEEEFNNIVFLEKL